ncbi:MAG: T9SS type A sorting domain-containing protein [Flavobacteriales bacterium]|nr:T9SS type A sorting domain-containing protein [Flavobacteriales bacterium]
MSLLVLELSGQSTWRRTYGGFDTDEARSVRQTADGGFVLLGSTGSFGFGGGDMYLIKLDASGLPEWSRTYTDAQVQFGSRIRVLPDGYLMAGTTTGPNGYDILLLKTDLNGMVQWQKQFGSEDWDLAADMELGPNNIFIVGTTYGDAGSAGDIWVICTDLSGDTLWTRTLGTDLEDQGLGAGVSSDGGVLVSGTSFIGPGDQDGIVAKLSATGDLEWSRSIGGDSTDLVTDVLEASSGSIVYCGNSRSYATVTQVLVGELSLGGDSVWQYTYGSDGDSETREIVETATGDFGIAMFNSSFNAGGRDMFLMIMDPVGGFVLGKNYGGAFDEEGFSVDVTPNGGFIVAGTTETYGPGSRAMYVVRVHANAETDDDTVFEMFDPLPVPDHPTQTNVVSFHPNPTSNTVTVRSEEALRSMSLFDATGRPVRTASLNGTTDSIDIDVPAGTYVANITFRNGGFAVQRLIVIP